MKIVKVRTYTRRAGFDKPLTRLDKQRAEKIMRIDDKIWKTYKFKSGDDVDRNWEDYILAVKKYIGRVPERYFAEFEGANYHSLNSAIEVLNLWKKN